MGSIHSYTTTSGWRYRISYRKPSGQQATLRGFRTKHEAEIRLAEVEISKNRGEFVDPSDSRAPLGSLGTEWLAARQADIKPSTFRSIDSAWRIHVRPKWERRAVGSIRHSEVRAWTSELAKTHSPTTVRRAHEVLAGILDVALRDRRIASNPARGVTLPRKVAKPRAYLTHQQVADLARESSQPELVTRAQVSADQAIADALAAGRQPPPSFPRVTPHDLRHTAASLAISAGAHVKAVQRMLGHASAVMTLDTYADLFDDDLDTVSEALGMAAASSDVIAVLSRDNNGDNSV